MSIEFDTPANRIIAQQQPKNQFRIDTTLSDLAFLRQCSVSGRLVFVQGSQGSGAGTVAEIIPAEGATLFVYRVVISNTSTTLPTILIQNDGNTRQQVIIPAAVATHDSRFIDSLVGNGTKSFRVEKTNIGTGTQLASIFGWIENTSRIRDVTI